MTSRMGAIHVMCAPLAGFDIMYTDKQRRVGTGLTDIDALQSSRLRSGVMQGLGIDALYRGAT